MKNQLTRKQLLAATIGGAAAFALSPLARAAETLLPRRRPNIILIVSDDQGYAELGCQGCRDIPTPALDAIAANGVRFTDGYVTGAVCSPTRAGLMTGRYQQRFGHEFNPGNSREAGLPLSELTLASRLQAAGYVTGMVGKWHLGMLPEQHPQSRGFDEFFGFLHGAHSYMNNSKRQVINDPIRRGVEPVTEQEYLTDAFRREALSFIERHQSAPFFLYLPFNAVHAPLEAPPNYLRPFEHITNPKRRTFAAMLSAMDQAVGAVLAKLEDLSLLEDTLILFLSDNGGPTHQTTSSNLPLRGEKGWLLEGGIRVPFLMQWKGELPAGRMCRTPVISLDLTATALAAAGAPSAQDPTLEGHNLISFLQTDSPLERPEALCWRSGSQSAIRKGRWKLYKRQAQPAQLFDLGVDQGEQVDLASRWPERVRELEAEYTSWDAHNVAPLWVRESF